MVWLINTILIHVQLEKLRNVCWMIMGCGLYLGGFNMISLSFVIFLRLAIFIRFATGIEFRESSLMIGPKCTATAKAGQQGH